MDHWTFHDPIWLLLLLALPFVLWLRSRRGAPAWVIPFAARWHAFDALPPSRVPVMLFYMGCALLMLAMARPQKVEDEQKIQKEGYDIVLAIDLSGSMMAEDYERYGIRLNRLAAIKPIVDAFIKQRSGDRIGLVVFGGQAYTFAPLTFDHSWLLEQTDRLKLGLIEDGTAIGDGLALAVNRLRLSGRDQSESRLGAFVVLLTDGANNRGVMLPMQAAELAKKDNIRVYTIGAGRPGDVPMPAFDQAGNKIGYQMVRSDLDEGTLKEISSLTGGKFFRAADSNTVDAAFHEIDAQEKVKFEATLFVKAQEYFIWLALPGTLLCLTAIFLNRRSPQEAFA